MCKTGKKLDLSCFWNLLLTAGYHVISCTGHHVIFFTVAIYPKPQICILNAEQVRLPLLFGVRGSMGLGCGTAEPYLDFGWNTTKTFHWRLLGKHRYATNIWASCLSAVGGWSLWVIHQQSTMLPCWHSCCWQCTVFVVALYWLDVC